MNQTLTSILRTLPSSDGDASRSVFGDSPPGNCAGRATLFAMTDFEHDEELDEETIQEFPLGDGTAETEALVYCPHCGEPNEVALDPGSGSDQEYVEDCQVCCRPWLMYVRYGRDGSAEVDVHETG